MSAIKSTAVDRLEAACEQRAAAGERLRLINLDEKRAALNFDTYTVWQRNKSDTEGEIGRLDLAIPVREAEAKEEARQQQESLVQAKARLRASEALVSRGKKEIAPLISKILDYVRDVAEAEIETARINARLAEDQRIQGPDMLARAQKPRSREDVKETPIDVWCFAETGVQVRDQMSVLDRGSRQGYIPSNSSAGEIRCVKLRAMSIDYYQAEEPGRMDPLFMALRLPFFDGAGFAWPGTISNPAQALEHLDRLRAKRDERQLLNEVVLIDRYKPPEYQPQAGRTRPDADRSVIS